MELTGRSEKLGKREIRASLVFLVRRVGGKGGREELMGRSRFWCRM